MEIVSNFQSEQNFAILFLRVDKVEKVGSGIGGIRKAMSKYGLKAKFDINENWFSVVFPRHLQVASERMDKTIQKLSRNYLENSPGDSGEPKDNYR